MARINALIKIEAIFFFFLLSPSTPTKCFVRVPPQVQIRQNKAPRHSAVSVWHLLHPLATSRFVSFIVFRLDWTFRACWLGLNLQEEAVVLVPKELCSRLPDCASLDSAVTLKVWRSVRMVKVHLQRLCSELLSSAVRPPSGLLDHPAAESCFVLSPVSSLTRLPPKMNYTCRQAPPL